MENLIYKNEVYELLACVWKFTISWVHGFLEIVYKDAIEIEFLDNQMKYEREKEFAFNYKGRTLNRKFNADFFVMDKIILEVKATREGISNEYITQTLNYLKASDCKLALIVNFGKSSLEYKRLVF